MDQFPDPSGDASKADAPKDTPKPPIWKEGRAGYPIVPDLPPPAAKAASPFADRQFFSLGAEPEAAAGSSRPSAFPPPPASGVTSGFDKPRWPTEPPTAGYQTSPVSPAPQTTMRPARAGLVVIGVMALLALAGSAFFVGRSFARSETATVPISNPAVVAPTEVPQPTTVPTPAPIPTSVPAPTVPLPGPASDDAVEPVAAAAAAVAPAVVLISNDLGQGSGIIYDPSGLLLTNAHVVGQFSEVRVQLASGVTVPGEVLGADPRTDVAVVRITTDEEFGVATLAPESSIEVGQLAVAIGSPFGLEQTVTSGVVSAIGRVIENQAETGEISVVAMIQTDAPINPGNSGGALADRQGRVIGMNTAIRTDGSGGNIGVGFAIPSDTAKLIADRIIAGEPLEQGFLGISGESPILGTPGARVIEVTPGSGAAAAGIVPGDLITRFNGQDVKSMSDLAAEVRLQTPDATVQVELLREGRSVLVDVMLGQLTES